MNTEDDHFRESPVKELGVYINRSSHRDGNLNILGHTFEPDGETIELPDFHTAEIGPSSCSWKVVMALKLGLILGLAFTSLIEFARAAVMSWL